MSVLNTLDADNWAGEVCSADPDTSAPASINRPTDGVHLSVNRAATTVLFGYRYNNPDFWSFVEKLIQEIDASNPFNRKRRRSIQEHREMRDALGNVLLTLFKSVADYLGALVGINLNRNFYSKRPIRYRKFHPSYNTMITIFRGLQRLNLIHVIKKGSFNRTNEDRHKRVNSTTRITPSKKLTDVMWDLRFNSDDVKYDLSAETIILRKTVEQDGIKTKIEVDYVDTSHTKRMRSDLFTINKLLEQSHIDIELTDAQYNQMQRQLMNDPSANYQPLDLNRKYLKRIFNEDFLHGGRFYGPWWQQIGRDWRKFIKINGEQTVEMDYKSFHPTLLYAKSGKPKPEDPYEIGLAVIARDYVKHMWNAIINAKNKRIRQPKNYNAKAMGLSWKELRVKTEEFHQSIKNRFYSRYGLRLQNLDANMANFIMIRLAKEEIFCLVIHDSFIVQVQHGAKLKQIMEGAAEKFAKTKIKIKIEEGEPNKINNELKEEEKRQYEGYLRRLDNYLNKEKKHDEWEVNMKT